MEFKSSSQYDYHVSTQLPSIPNNTIIIMVVGIGQGNATPDLDGWFLSDFVLFWHMLQGTTNKQHWLHCLDIPSLLEEQPSYYHGSPPGNRKLVLNSEIYEKIKSSKHSWEEIPETNFLLHVDGIVQKTCEEAEKENLKVMIGLLGHGIVMFPGDKGNPLRTQWGKYQVANKHKEGKGIVFGTAHTAAMGMNKFLKEIKTNIDVMLLTSAFYSGGWSFFERLHISANNPISAGISTECNPTKKSTLIKRHLSVFYSSHVVGQMTYDSSRHEYLEDCNVSDKEKEEEMEDAYSKLEETISETLLNLDRQDCDKHQITFDTKQDLCADLVSARAGIFYLSQVEMKKKWEALPNYRVDTDNLKEWECIPATYDKALCSLYFEKNLEFVKNLFGGSHTSFQRVVASLAYEYSKLVGGDEDDIAGNHGLHGNIYALLENKLRETEELISTWLTLQYRLEVIATADRVLEALSFQKPDGLTCREYNHDRFVSRNGRDKRIIDECFETFEDVGGFSIFPHPTYYGMKMFIQGAQYLVAAIFRSVSREEFTKAEIFAKLRRIIREFDAGYVVLKEVVRGVDEVEEKLLKLCWVMKSFLGDLEPAGETNKLRRSQSMSVILK